MRIGVLCSPGSWYFRDLQRAAADRHELIALSFRSLSSKLIPNSDVTAHSGPWELATLDALLVRTMPPGSLEQVVFRMDVLGQLERSGLTVVNPSRAIETAVDKYLALAKLQAAGLLVPATWTGQDAEQAMIAFAELGGDVVVKPLFGSEGRGIARINDEALALRAFKLLEQLGAVIYVQQFVPHEGADYRLLVIGREVIGIRRCNPLDWRTNLSRGAQAVKLLVDDQQRELALRAASVVGAPLAGVDLLPGRDGQLYALEVNAVPGWKGSAQALQVDVAARILTFVEQTAMGERAKDGGDLGAEL